MEPEVCAPERSRSPPGQELLGVITSHGPSRECYTPTRKSRGWAAEAIAPSATDAALSAEGMRAALSSQARQRYCSERCREAARKWSRWKGQQRYRATRAGQQKRNGQGRRYRERVKSRKPPEPEAINHPARVITTEHFFRPLLRPARLLRAIRASAAKSFATLLLPHLPAGAGACPGPGAALETGARFNPEILIRWRRWPYIQPV
jgi:hypothetical protein